jgi:hypothetical protein
VEFTAPSQPLDQQIELVVGNDERRSKQQMITARAIDRATHRITHQPGIHRGLFYFGVKL